MSTPADVSAQINLMSTLLDRGSDASDNGDLSRTVHFGSAAVCSGLLAVITELKLLRTAIEKKND